MIIYNQIDEIKRDPNTVLTIGTFDGVHLGHQEIVKKLLERSNFHSGRNILITFNPHPRKVVNHHNNQKILTTIEEKIEILKELGLENLFIIHFTKEFSQLSPKEFIEDFIIKRIGLKEIIVGYDHKFGKGREGNQETLRILGKELGFEISVVNEFKINEEIVNSTKIRQALLNGNIKQANLFLGRYYSFSGLVVEGDKRGRLLGYPTANLKLNDEDKLLPGLGIYAAEVTIDSEKHFGLLSVGQRPTFYDHGEVVPEVYIYNFNKDVYNKNLKICIIEKLRGEEKFESPEELINQMNKDKEAGLKIFERINSINNSNLKVFK